MASVQSKLLNLVTRLAMRVLFRGHKPPAQYREMMVGLDRRLGKPLPSGIITQDVDLPVPGRWFRNSTATSAQVLLYLHGGAFIMRLPTGHTAMVASLCNQCGVSAFMAWYRLAPEHPFPSAPEDCLAAYRALLESGHEPRDIVIIGDSAGGNLTFSLLHLIRRAGLPMPSAAIGLSPITDFAQISATWRMNTFKDPMYRVQGKVNPVKHYLQGASPLDPVASPYYGSFEGFPPLYFMVGGIEALLDDSVGMARKAVEAGISTKVQIWLGMPHVFTLQHGLPETHLAKQELAGWLAALRDRRGRTEAIYRSVVEVMDVAPFTGRLTRVDNNVYLG